MPPSLSARRAWIEIIEYNEDNPRCPVALRKESVDRNVIKNRTAFSVKVALRKESVDRNVPANVAVVPAERRSPQGERG